MPLFTLFSFPHLPMAVALLGVSCCKKGSLPPNRWVCSYRIVASCLYLKQTSSHSFAVWLKGACLGWLVHFTIVTLGGTQMFIWSPMVKLEPKGFNIETIRCRNGHTLVLYNKKLLEITDLWTGVQKRTDEKSHEVICNCQGCRLSKHAKYVRVNNRKCARNDAHDSSEHIHLM